MVVPTNLGALMKCKCRNRCFTKLHAGIVSRELYDSKLYLSTTSTQQNHDEEEHKIKSLQQCTSHSHTSNAASFPCSFSRKTGRRLSPKSTAIRMQQKSGRLDQASLTEVTNHRCCHYTSLVHYILHYMWCERLLKHIRRPYA